MQKMKKFISLLLTSIFVIMSLPVYSFADTSPDPEVSVNIVDENTVITIVGNVTCLATKDDTTVSYKYFVDGQEIYEYTGDLEIAEKRGQAFLDSKESRAIINNSMTRSVVVVDPGGGGTPSGSYRFDGVTYISAYDMPYAHPNKDYHFISPYRNWFKEGDKYNHFQLNANDSEKLLQSPAWAIGSALGAGVGAFIGNTPGAVVGAFAGGFLGAWIGADFNRLLDEDGCIWFVYDREREMVNSGNIFNPQYTSHFEYIAIGHRATYDYYAPLSTSGNPL